MAEHQKPTETMAQTRTPPPPTPSPPSIPSSGVSDFEAAGRKAKAKAGVQFPNPPDPFNPDPATLREQWRFAIRQYSRWYSHAWGTAILAGVSFFALGWLIKGSNPLPSRGLKNGEDRPPPTQAGANTD